MGVRTVLLTLGRLPVGLEIARSFADAGWQVIVAETRSMHLCRTSRSVDQCLRVPAPQANPVAFRDAISRIIRDARVDIVVPVSEETPYVAALQRSDFPGTRFFCASASDVVKLHDKLEFNQTAASMGLPVPRSWAGDRAAEASASGSRLVAKPRFACSGRGVRYYSAGQVPQTDRADVIQTEVHGALYSTCGIARDGRILANAIYRARVLSGSVAVAFERLESAPDIDSWVERFVRESGHTGFVSFDFIVDHSGVPQAIECNPRATSGIHFLAPRAVARLLSEPDTSMIPDTQWFRPEFLLTEAYSCYTALLAALPRPSEARRIFNELRAARDVTWRRDDPWPFLTMTVNSWPIIFAAARSRRPFAEVAMTDIEWRPDYD